MGDIDHFFRDDPGASEFELGDELTGPACAERPLSGAERRKTIRRHIAVVLGLDRARLRFGKVAGFDPSLAHRLQTAGKIDRYVAFGIGPGWIVDPDRRLVRVGERNLAKRDADIGAAARGGIDFARARNRPSGHGPRRGEFGNLVHGRLLAHQVRRRESGGPIEDLGRFSPFAGMTRIRFKGFGSSPSQPRSGRPSSNINVVLAARTVNSVRAIDIARLPEV